MEKRKILLASVVIIGIMLLLNSCTNYCDLELINVKTTSSCSFLDTLIKVGIPINEEETGPIDTLCSPQKGSVSYYRVNSSGEPKDHAGWFDIDFDNRTISRNSTHYVEIGERLLTLQIDCPGYYYYIIYMDCGDDSLAAL